MLYFYGWSICIITLFFHIKKNMIINTTTTIFNTKNWRIRMQNYVIVPKVLRKTSVKYC